MKSFIVSVRISMAAICLRAPFGGSGFIDSSLLADYAKSPS